MIKNGTHVWISPLYAYGRISLLGDKGAHGVIEGWSDYFQSYKVLVDGFKDYILVDLEGITVLNNYKENDYETR